MTENPLRPPRTIWIGFTLLFGFMGLAFALWFVEFIRNYRPPLPVIGPVADFTLTNQDGKITTLADLTNHVWVADIIFTRCAGPCPRLTRPDEIAAGSVAGGQRRETRHAHDRPGL